MPEVVEEQVEEPVAQAVAELTRAVEGMREGLIDEEQVRRIADDVVQQSQANRSGYTPPDDVDPELARRGLPASGPARLRALHATPARRGAAMAGRPVEDVQEFHRASDQLVLLSTIMGRDAQDTNFFEETYLPAARAMDSATAGEGAEFVPTNLSSSLIERVALELKVLDLFGTIPMPTNPFDIPGRAMSRTRGGRHTEQTADTGQTKIKVITPGSRKVTLRAAKFASEVLVSKEEEEDAIIAVLPFIEEEIVDFTSFDLEDTAQNGDTAGSHRDTDVSASDDPRKNWDGLRKAANAAGAERDGGAVKINVAGLRANRGLMGKYGVNPTQLAHIVGIQSYIDLLSDANVVTLDKYGSNATILSGELGKVDGAPIVVSEAVRTNLNATGVYQAANAKSIALTVHRKGFVRGTRREMSVQILRELYAESDQDALIVTTRQAFANRYPGQAVAAATVNVAPGV